MLPDLAFLFLFIFCLLWYSNSAKVKLNTTGINLIIYLPETFHLFLLLLQPKFQNDKILFLVTTFFLQARLRRVFLDLSAGITGRISYYEKGISNQM